MMVHVHLQDLLDLKVVLRTALRLIVVVVLR